jgi:Ca2+-transporting ATPase
MQRPPRKADTPILGPFVIFRTILVALLMAASSIGLFLHELHRNLKAGEAPALATSQAQTMAVTSIVLFQVFYLLNCRSLKEHVFRIGLFSNPAVWPGIGALLVLQAAFVHMPALNRLFGSSPLDPIEWLKSAAAAAIVLPVVAVEKLIRKRIG